MKELLRSALRWVRLLTTTRDNQTPDVIRIGAILLGTQFLVLGTWDVIAHKHHFNFTDFGTGAGLLLAATGTALRLKKSDEPEPKE